MSDDGYIEWRGNRCPVPDHYVVSVRLRDGRINQGEAGWYMWLHVGAGNDIVGYKVIAGNDIAGKVEPTVTAPGLLDEAARIMEERAKQYDQPGGERSMAKTVSMFNTATGRNLTEVEGWFFMECLKNVRFFQNTEKPHEDSVKDKIAYAALMGEAALR